MSGGVRRTAVAFVVVAVTATSSACAETREVVIRQQAADDIQVMTPEEVRAARPTVLPELEPIETATSLEPADSIPPIGAGTSPAAGSPTNDSVPASEPAEEPAEVEETIPLNKDDRSPEARLFEAFGTFRRCIEDAGYKIEGNLQDRNNPAFQDPDYVKVLTKCAARSDIVNILEEMRATQAEMTPDQIQERNENFKILEECLKRRGWTIETATQPNGLISPTTFLGPNGTLDERDINQCITETGISTTS